MRIGKSKNPSMYKCDKCGKYIHFERGIGKGFKKVSRYYKWSYDNYVPIKDFDLCESCENEFREWLNIKPIKNIYKTMIESFPEYEPVAEEELKFTISEEEILRILMQNKERYLNTKTIVKELNSEECINCWKFDGITERAVVTSISRINRKLKHSKIINKYNAGYRIIGFQ